MSDKPEDEVVFVVQTAITKTRLQEIINLLNEQECGENTWRGEEDEQWPLLTIEEVLGNPELLTYLCEGSVNPDDELYEAWNNEVFIDFNDLRK